MRAVKMPLPEWIHKDVVVAVSRRLFSFLSSKPTIERFGPRLTATTAPILQWLSLFSYCRQVVVDARSAEVIIRRCRGWIYFDEERIPFDRVRQIDYDVDPNGSAWARAITVFRRGDRREDFSVTLILDDPPQRRHLFSFLCDADVDLGLPGELGTDGFIRIPEAPESGSLGYVYGLQEFLHVPLTNALEIYWGKSCVACGRKNPPQREDCMYCGESFVESAASRE